MKSQTEFTHDRKCIAKNVASELCASQSTPLKKEMSVPGQVKKCMRRKTYTIRWGYLALIDRDDCPFERKKKERSVNTQNAN